MANIFKVITKANVNNSAADTIYTVPSSGSGKTSVVLGLVLSNTTTNNIEATVTLESDTADTETNTTVTLLKNVAIPQASTLEMFAGQKLVLQKTDVIKAQSNTASALDVALSILEMDN